jgi:uncharacterized protein (TIGR02147 family)
MEKNIYEFKTYKDYLRARAGQKGTRKGIKTALARLMNCQPTYLSQILHAHAHLSLEQAEKINSYFEHTKEESLFFLLLVQKDRAGTQTLTKHFQEQIDELLKKRLVITHRLGKGHALSPNDQSVYYSSWIFAAIHMALTIPALRTREAIGDYLHLPVRRVTEVLDFLVSIGLARVEKNSFLPGAKQIRLGNDSHNIIKHHTNWRNQAIDSLDREQISDLHYSGAVSLSKHDVIKIKNVLLDAIKSSQEIIKDSPEEELYSLNLDFFSLKR